MGKENSEEEEWNEKRIVKEDSSVVRRSRVSSLVLFVVVLS